MVVQFDCKQCKNIYIQIRQLLKLALKNEEKISCTAITISKRKIRKQNVFLSMIFIYK